MVYVKVIIELKEGITDPEGMNVKKSLNLLGFKSVKSVKSAKVFKIELRIKDKKRAKKEVEEMCKKLLVNPVIHTYKIEID